MNSNKLSSTRIKLLLAITIILCPVQFTLTKGHSVSLSGGDTVLAGNKMSQNSQVTGHGKTFKTKNRLTLARRHRQSLATSDQMTTESTSSTPLPSTTLSSSTTTVSNATTVPTTTTTTAAPQPTTSTPSPLVGKPTAKVFGLRVEESSKPVTYRDGVSVVLADSEVLVRLFGVNFTHHTNVRFVAEKRKRGEDCDDLESTKKFELLHDSIDEYSALAKVRLPPLDVDESEFYICAREMNIDMPWVHQGGDHWIVMTSYRKLLPLWAHILLLIGLLVLSGLFSGLNLGLMAMDQTELKIIANTGTDTERSYAKKIIPLRTRGNFLLCSVLLGNVMFNSTLTILLDDLTTGLIAIVGSTLGIVIFGEIIPQAFCSRYGLAVGAKTIWITKFTMAITFPLSFPVSIVLDKILGEEIGNVYNRKRLMELIKVTENYNDLKKDEVNVIEGVLKLAQLTCADIMTKLEDVYMLSLESVLDFDTISEIMTSGYSRIPIYEKERSNIVTILFTKDLAFVDPDDKMPVKSICEFYQYPINFVEDTKRLDEMFREFKAGSKGHMAFVQKIQVFDSVDPFYKVVGLVTLEDVIEELIQAEINDETDVLTNNRLRRRSKFLEVKRNLKKVEESIVSSQLVLATYQYLSASIPGFGQEYVSKNILGRLLKQDVYCKIKVEDDESGNAYPILLYENGKPADYFALILEGRVSIMMGKEDLVFESGPFSFFGTQVLTYDAPGTPMEMRKTVAVQSGETFIPDYTVRAVTDLIYLKITRTCYVAARHATALERQYQSDPANNSNKCDMEPCNGNEVCQLVDAVK